MRPQLSRAEMSAIVFMAVLTLVGVIAPAIAQPEAYHQFADQRALLSIPHFCDVLSNLVFTIAGAAGLLRLHTTALRARADTLPLRFFFFGLLCTGFGSAFYHWAPTTQSLVFDRLPMVIAFAGVIGTFLTQKVSPRAGIVGLAWALALGAGGLCASVVTGNLAPYLALQFGGLIGLLAGLALVKDTSATRFPWWALVGWYALAKVLELGDQVVWGLTLHVVSGHTLKHLAAGMAGVVVVRWLSTVGEAGRRGQLEIGYT